MSWRVGLSGWLFALLFAALAPPVPAHGAIVVRYPRPESGPDERSRYTLRLLELALQRAPAPYRVELNPVRMQQGRALVQLRNNEGIDVLSTMTSSEREAQLQPIRIPIDKGLIGWRLLLIRKADAGRFVAPLTLASLKKLKAGQGSDWPDTPIMRANGLKVYGTSNYEALFNMLESGRIDYFPRAVSEIWTELELHEDALAVEPSVVLRYPTAIYYFVRKGDKRLAADLTAGLEQMIADGSFDKLFDEFYGEMIRKADLKNRSVIHLKNPLMPSRMPLERRQLWF